jgi:maleylacetate reductase
MDPFVYTSLPGRIVFGFGTLARVPAEIEALGGKRALVLCDRYHEDRAGARLRDHLGSLVAGFSSEAAMHTPVAVTERVMRQLSAVAADCLVALGGGSTIGLSKALALRTDLPQIVIPTTYAGSEATPILGETMGDRKATQRSPKILPEVVVYDVELTLALPPLLSAVSGINAIAHAVEALYAKDANPITSLLAERGIAALGGALPVIVKDPHDRAARADALFGAWACGNCLGTVGMALHHKLCHVLGGSFDLPHAETHTVVLPHVAAFNTAGAPEALARAARALLVEHAAQGLFELAEALGAPRSLKALGMQETDLDRAAATAVSSPYWNPRPVDREAIRALLDNAYHGRRPQS